MPFLIPALLINVVIILVPAFLTLAMAFFEWDGATTPVFAGFDNFRTIFDDPVFFTALLNNIKWTLIFLTIPIVMGFFAGVDAARRRVAGERSFRPSISCRSSSRPWLSRASGRE